MLPHLSVALFVSFGVLIFLSSTSFLNLLYLIPKPPNPIHQLGGLSPNKEGNASNRGAGAITRAFFMAADADGDGVINRDELVEAASALGLTPSETEMDALFRQ